MPAFLLALLVSIGLTAPGAAFCGRPSAERTALAHVNERLELTLETGRLVRLAGLEERLAPATRERLTQWLTGQALQIEWLGSTADRWGRHAARVFAPDRQGQLISVAEALLDAGLARVEIDPLARPCLRDFLLLEDKARQARRGFWNQEDERPVPATDRASLIQRSGQSVIVEGRIISVGQTRAMAYLNFGPARSYDFAIVLDRRLQNSFDSSGTKLSALAGKQVRVRGWMDVRLGPHIQIHEREALEITGTEGAVSPKSEGRAQP
jgi:hypothetical protein